MFLLPLCFLSGCGEKEELSLDRNVTELYHRAVDLLEAKDYTKAANAFAEVERQHPYSRWAIKAQLLSAYSFYEARRYDEAIEAFRTFIQLHPSHDDIAYSYYMLGLCYYEQIPIIERDQKSSQQSLEAFDQVVQRFPETKHACDAVLKMDLIRDHLAGKEMDIGRFYQKQGSHSAAVNRFKVIIQNYDKTSHIEEALHRLVESYSALGLFDESKASAAVLNHNYPKSDWYKKSYPLIQQFQKKHQKKK